LSPLPRAQPAEPIQLLDPTGTLTQLGFAMSPSPDCARQLYRDMFLARRFDTEAFSLQRKGELGLWLMSLGQEAAQVGSIRALRDTDHVFPSYREHAAALCRGIVPAELLGQWRGIAHSGWDPDTYRFHIYTLVLAAQTLHATGYAMGVQRDGVDELVLTYFGDGATSQGDFNEALVWASSTRAPVLFFCQNNQWAISTPVSTQSRVGLHTRAAGFGLPSYVVDGNDALAVHEVTRQAASGVRSGSGPAFIEAVTYRMAGHSTSDDPTRYRVEAEVEQWRQRDPLTRMRQYLQGILTPKSYFDRLDDEADRLSDETRSVVATLADPAPASIFDHVYAGQHPLLEEQREQFAAYLATFEER